MGVSSSGVAGPPPERPMRCRTQKQVTKCFREVKCPYQHISTAHGSHGPINYSLVGPAGGEVVMCFHGLNGSRMLFHDFGEVLSRECGFRVLSFDLYGHGLSNAPKVDLCCCGCSMPSCCDTPRARYDMEFFVAQTDELLQSIGLGEESINVVGFSLGGSIAVAFAKCNPERVKRMVIISPAGFLPKVPKLYYLLQCLWCIIIPLAPHVLCTCWYRRDRFKRQLKREDEHMDDDVVESLWSRFVWQLFVKRGVASATLAALRRVPWFNLRPLFKDVGRHQRPVLLMWGERDALNPVQTVAQEVKDLFSNGQLCVIKNAGHICLCDQPRQAILSIVHFLRQPPDVRMDQVHIAPATLRPSRQNAVAAGLAQSQAKGQTAIRVERAMQMPVPVVLGHTEQVAPEQPWQPLDRCQAFSDIGRVGQPRDSQEIDPPPD